MTGASKFRAEFPSFDGFTAARFEGLLKEHGHETVYGPNGFAITFQEALQKMHSELAEADAIAKAHEAAAACFLQASSD
ncbi:MAG: hypothetical protein ACTHOL_17445 [Luteibacter jiangsuensis]